MVPFCFVVFQLVVGLMRPQASKQASVRHGIRPVSSACYLTVVSWLTYNNVLSGPKHLRSHESVGQLLVDAVDWTLKGAVSPVKNREQCDACWALSDHEFSRR